MTRYGDQPVRDILRDRKMTLKQLAAATGIGYSTLYAAVTGVVRPNNAIRERVPTFLGVELGQCFTAEAIQHPSRYGIRDHRKTPFMRVTRK